MSHLLAAVGATVAALVELTVVPYFRVGVAHPHPVLVLGVVWAIAVGIEGGLVWAFVGGLALDVLAQRPLGSTTFALLVSIAGAALVGRALSRVRPLAPILVVFIFSFVYSMILLVLFSALRAPIAPPDPVATLLPGAVYDAALAAVVGPLAIALYDRHVAQERMDW
jgi:rod shape-determining protein MreD